MKTFLLLLTVELSRRLCISIFESLNGWSIGTQNLLQMILGTPLLDIVGLDSRLQAERAKYLVADLKEAANEEGKAQALCNFIVQRQKGLNQGDKPPPVPYRFVTPTSQGLDIDMRLCNQEIISSAKPHLLHILNCAMLGWMPDRRKELLKKYKAEGIQDADEIAYNMNKAMTGEYYDKVCDWIMIDQGKNS